MHWLFDQAERQTPGLTLQLRWRPEVTIEQFPGGVVIVGHPWGALRLEGISPAILASLKQLASSWIERSELWSMASECGATDPAAIAASLSQHSWILEQLGFLCRLRLVAHGRPLMTIEPLSSAASLWFGNTNGTRLSRFAYLQRHDDGLAMESAVAGHRVILHDAWGACLIGSLSGAESTAADGAIDDETRRVAIGLLNAAGLLEGSERVAAAGFGDQLLQMGEFHDLLFHRRSRYGHHDGPFGAEFPYLQTIAEPAARAPRLAEVEIALPSPSHHEVHERDMTLSQALERRVSVRQYSDQPVTLPRLGEFLFRCARTRGQYGPAPAAGMPYHASDRPYPSGGGIHDLELYLIVGHVGDLRPGAYHYAADRHALEMLAAGEQDYGSLLKGAMRASGATEPPPVLIKIASRFGRTSWKYRSISYATTLKNVGVLYQTMYLVATAMGLAGCALGSGDEVAAEQALNLAARSEIGVGEFMLGNPAAGIIAERQFDPTWLPMIEPQWGRD
jgi:SagB-type dehydrogenase family enzyme